jgi:hypothetical protein
VTRINDLGGLSKGAADLSRGSAPCQSAQLSAPSPSPRHRAVQQEHRDQADQGGGEGAQRGALALLEAAVL